MRGDFRGVRRVLISARDPGDSGGERGAERGSERRAVRFPDRERAAECVAERAAGQSAGQHGRAVGDFVVAGLESRGVRDPRAGGRALPSAVRRQMRLRLRDRLLVGDHRGAENRGAGRREIERHRGLVVVVAGEKRGGRAVDERAEQQLIAHEAAVGVLLRLGGCRRRKRRTGRDDPAIDRRLERGQRAVIERKALEHAVLACHDQHGTGIRAIEARVTPCAGHRPLRRRQAPMRRHFRRQRVHVGGERNGPLDGGLGGGCGAVKVGERFARSAARMATSMNGARIRAE